jgi:hypothetical protein
VSRRDISYIAVRENIIELAHISKHFNNFKQQHKDFTMTTNVRVSCINKTFRQDPHSRIMNIGGIWTDSKRWKISQQQAISDIESEKFAFYVSANGNAVWIVVAMHNGYKYIKTENDGLHPNNLLSLPECL